MCLIGVINNLVFIGVVLNIDTRVNNCTTGLDSCGADGIGLAYALTLFIPQLLIWLVTTIYFLNRLGHLLGSSETGSVDAHGRTCVGIYFISCAVALLVGFSSP